MAGPGRVTNQEGNAPTASALRIVVVAERLFAQHGIDGVSLRQISTESGNSNNSAVQYHFGSKEGLISSIFQHRLPRLISERRMLTAGCDPTDLRSRFEAYYLPVLNLAEEPDNHYVSFVEQLQRRWLSSGSSDVGMASHLTDLPLAGREAIDDVRHDLQHLLAHVEEPLRSMRISNALGLALHAAADRERAVTTDMERAPFGLFVNALIDGLVGFLAAPASPSTEKWLGKSDNVEAGRLHAL
jgi:AcrR family transcriptional regulator